MTRRGSLFPSAREDRDHSRRSTSTTRRTQRDCQRQKRPMSDRRTAKRRWARDANSRDEQRSTVEVNRMRSSHLCLIFDHGDFHAGRRAELLSNARISNGNGATFDQETDGETTDAHPTRGKRAETGPEPLIGRLEDRVQFHPATFNLRLYFERALIRSIRQDIRVFIQEILSRNAIVEEADESVKEIDIRSIQSIPRRPTRCRDHSIRISLRCLPPEPRRRSCD